MTGCGDDTSKMDMNAPQDLSMPDLTTAPPDLTNADLSPNLNFFAPLASYPVGTGPVYVVVYDTRGNGKQDIVVASLGTPPNVAGDVTVSLNNGDGTFQNATHYSLGGVGDAAVVENPNSAALADVDGDGHADIVVGLSSSNIAVLYGNGDGTFNTTSEKFPSNVTGGLYVALGKIANGTTHVDAVISDSFGNQVSVLTGSGVRGPTNFAATSHLFTVGPGPSYVVVQDFDKNGSLDVATVNLTDSTVSVLLNNGSVGTPVSFQTVANYMGGGGADGLAAGDINADGKLDLVTANVNDNTVSVLIGKGDGTFMTKVDYPTGTGTSPAAIAIGDFNQDSHMDLVTANSATNNISLLLANPGGGFAMPLSFPAGNNPSHLAAGLLNNDTKPDVVVGDFKGNAVSVLLNIFQ
jgi:hypothetical protein